MRRIFWILVLIILLLVSGCNKGNVTVSGEEKTAEDYIKSQGYKITAHKGEINKYTLEKNKLQFGKTENIPYQQMWAVQKVEPDNYFGKEITIYGFTVKNHPLQKRDSTAKKGVNLYIMLTDGKVIGGYSYPNADVFGAYSSLDGKTLEEFKGINFQEWSEEWKKKYGSSNSIENEEQIIKVQKRIKDKYEKFKTISNKEQVQKMKEILEDIEWQYWIYDRGDLAPYKFGFQYKNPYIETKLVSYDLWTIPNNMVQVGINAENKWFTFDKNKSAEILEILIDEKLSDQKKNATSN